MKLLTLTFLIIGSLATNQAYAEDTQPLARADCDKAGMAWDANANLCVVNSGDVSPQPLTRLDCEKAGAVWNDNANVCGMASNEAKAMPVSEVSDNSGQPLTKNACDKAGMTWSDKTNVCGEKSAATQATLKAFNTIASSILVNIDKAKQKMTVFVDGVERYDWPVSTGGPGYATPSGTYTASSMNKIWYSKQWDNAPMPHAVFFTKEGHAIHGTYEVKRLGKPASHGCVRLSPQNAATLYALVEKSGLKSTEVALTGLTPGGEDKVASSAKSKTRYRQAHRSFERGNNYYAKSEPQPRRRGGFFRGLFGGR